MYVCYVWIFYLLENVFNFPCIQIYDTWHPYERAAYPEYFERRHQRKLEFIEAYDKKYAMDKSQ